MTTPNTDGSRDPSPHTAFRAAKHLCPLIAYVVYIFISGTSTNSAPPMNVSDKTAHFVAFGSMVPFILYAFRYFPWGLRLKLSVPMAVLVSSGLGALLEFWQYFLPYRSCELADWEADTLGALFFGAMVWMVMFALERRESRSQP